MPDRKFGSERETDRTPIFTQPPEPAGPRGTGVGYCHPLGRAALTGVEARERVRSVSWVNGGITSMKRGERLDEGVGVSRLPGLQT